ncbi:MAG: hypothetical protein EA380_06435 [Phycisphaeraceae bacterium]|nr:MAG: hypothetical protein EA380_06435 [Phycisphaeraceae bacterium]
MFIAQVTNADSLPSLQATIQFAAQRHALITHNIANLNTPNYEPVDVDPRSFQRQLGEAIDRRRTRFGGHRGDLNITSSREVAQDGRGRLQLRPRASGQGILYHDRNNRDLERTMQDLVENAGVFRVATELLRSRVDILNTAIRERL